MAQWLREYLLLLQRTQVHSQHPHQVAHISLKLYFQEITHPLLASGSLCTHASYISNRDTYIKKNKSSEKRALK